MTLPRHPEARAQRASKGDGPAARAASFEGGLRPPPQDDGQLRDARRRVAGFAHTLRDNGFKVGLAETQDALAILASPAALRPSSLKPALRALFCATHSDWERFDEIFDAYWQGRHMRQRQVLTGAPGGNAPPARRLAQAQVPQDTLGLPDHVERRSGGDSDAPADGRGRREGASRAESAHDDGPAPYRRSRRRGGDPRACGAARPRDAGAAGAPRAGAPARPAARPAPHHSSQRLAWRHAARPRLAAPQDQAAAPRHAARCLGLDEPLHGVLRPLPARRRRRLPRSRGLRLPHPARACVAVAARPRRDARGRPAGADGAGHRRRHAHRREPRDLQPLACAARDQFAHRRDDRLRRLRHRRAGAARRGDARGCGGAAAASSGSIR